MLLKPFIYSLGILYVLAWTNALTLIFENQKLNFWYWIAHFGGAI